VRSLETAPIYAVQHFCLHDGPGVRSCVFFKGCPLRCAWCHNPEGQRAGSELAFKPHLCIGCGRCVEICEARVEPGLPDQARCRTRFRCVEACPSGALLRYGEPLTVSAVVEALRSELPLLVSSGGGVTLSGGEPTTYAAFAARLAGLLAEEGVHVAVQTCGAFDLDDPDVKTLLDSVDLLLFDVKLADPAAHRLWTGQDNEGIVANLRRLADRLPVWPRMPLVPEVNDAPEQLDAMAELLIGCGLGRLTLVPYHDMGRSRSAWLGRGEGRGFDVPDDARIDAVRERLVAAGLEVFEPGEES
jgi:glycyl-radical enzyme activating protein